jgi:predicted ATPase/class 3 adenylate cyclase
VRDPSRVRADLPTGTVTFLFTDVEGSTRLLDELGLAGYGELLASHHRICREAWVAHGGVEVDTAGDAFFVAFPTASGALEAAAHAQAGLAAVGIPVRMGVHTGEVSLNETGYVGLEVHRAARIAAAGHGGQVLVSASTASLAAVELRDLGEHRFKDLAAAERVFQLGEVEFPPIRSLYRSNVPVPATTFLGREQELADVVDLLSRDGVRLVTLTGPAGTGKTRLALQAAAEVSDSFPDGVWWVALAPLRDPALLLPSIAQTLSVKEQPGLDLAGSLAAQLAGKRMLVLLDNAEHLLPGLASELSRLRVVVPTLVVLVTSRERLQLAGEEVWPVPSLAQREGVELFLARSESLGATPGDGPLVWELCARLDSLPLALELAAARTVVFSPEQLLERLGQSLDLLKGGRDADPRQQTLRATIDWSYQLLDEDERRVLQGLSIFAGGCTYDAAEQVADADPDTLQSLLDKSLLRRRDTDLGPRYWLLETISEYVREVLDRDGATAALSDRHARYFAALTVSSYEPLRMMDDAAIARAHVEMPNLRLTLRHAEDAGDGTMLADLVLALCYLWQAQGENREADYWLGVGLTATQGLVGRERLMLLRQAASFADVLGSAPRALELLEEALRLCEVVEDDVQRASVMVAQALLLVEAGDGLEATALLESAVRTTRATGDARALGGALHDYGLALCGLGDPVAGERVLVDAREVLERAGIAFGVSLTDQSRGYAAVIGRNWGSAIAFSSRSLAFMAERGYRECAAISLVNLGLACVWGGDVHDGICFLTAGRKLFDMVAHRETENDRHLAAEAIAHARELLTPPEFETSVRRGEETELSELVTLAASHADMVSCGSG